MNKKHKIIILILGMISMLLVYVIYATYVSSVDVLNISKIGIIDINLKTYTIKDNQEVELSNIQESLSKDVLSYIPKISKTEDSGESYVRIKVLLDYNNTKKEIDDTYIIDLNNDFVYKSDGYFYYVKKLGEEEITIFEGIKLDNEMLNSNELKVEVKAEAIQAKNINVNFESDNPWETIGQVEIKEATTSSGGNNE